MPKKFSGTDGNEFLRFGVDLDGIGKEVFSEQTSPIRAHLILGMRVEIAEMGANWREEMELIDGKGGIYLFCNFLCWF